MKYPKTLIVADVCTDYIVIYFNTPSIREIADVQKVASEMDEVLAGFRAPLVVLNFSRVNMLSSSFLGKLIGLRTRLKADDVELRVCCMPSDVLTAFKLLNLHKLIKVYPSLEKALS